MSQKRYHLRCVRCNQELDAAPEATICPRCPKDVDRPGILDLVYSEDFYRDPDLEKPLRSHRRENGIWSFERLLPVDRQTPKITLGEAHTPLIEAPALALHLGMASLWLKNEFQGPTGSLKDRIAPLVVAKALETGARTMVIISSGNMAHAVAAYGAASGLRTVAIMSPSVKPERALLTELSGGIVFRVRGTSADRIRLCLEAADHFGWYNATSPYNPYGPHGAKTLAYETFLYAREFDWIVFPVGFGCNIVGAWKGFQDLLRLGLIERIPRFAAVQPEGSPSLVKAFESGLAEALPGPQKTIAGGISQVVTPNSVLALRAIRKTNGTAIAVSDRELMESVVLMAQKAGAFIEPAGAASLAGLRRLVEKKEILREDKVLLVITGSGLKEPYAGPWPNDGKVVEMDPSVVMMERHLPPGF